MENKEKKNNTKEIVISVLSILILIVAVVGISYAVWSQTFMGGRENNLNTGYISFSYTESNDNVIAINNAVPMSDENGKKQNGTTSMFDFTVSASYAGVDSLNYEVSTTPITSTLDEKYVKVYLTDQNDNPVVGYKESVPTYDMLKDSLTEGSKTIYESSISSSGSSKKLRLRIWVSSDYNLPDVSRTFSFKVNVKGSV